MTISSESVWKTVYTDISFPYTFIAYAHHVLVLKFRYILIAHAKCPGSSDYSDLEAEASLCTPVSAPKRSSVTAATAPMRRLCPLLVLLQRVVKFL